MATKKRSPKGDSKAATCSGQGDELKEAMQTLRQGDPSDSPPSAHKHRRHPGDAAKTKPAGAAAPVGQSTTINDEVMAEGAKTELNLRELRFLELHISGEHSVEDSMKFAGYEGYHQSYLYKLSRKIIQKYEQGAGDARKIMRAVGVGEIAVAKKILELMSDSSKNIQLRAVELAAKVLGMSRESVEVAQGITIVIKSTDQGPTGPAPGRPLQEAPKALPSPTPLCITK